MEIPFKYSSAEASARFLERDSLGHNKFLQPTLISLIERKTEKLSQESIMSYFFQESGPGIRMAAALVASDHEILDAWTPLRIRFGLYSYAKRDIQKIIVSLIENSYENKEVLERRKMVLEAFQLDLQAKKAETQIRNLAAED